MLRQLYGILFVTLMLLLLLSAIGRQVTWAKDEVYLTEAGYVQYGYRRDGVVVWRPADEQLDKVWPGTGIPKGR